MVLDALGLITIQAAKKCSPAVCGLRRRHWQIPRVLPLIWDRQALLLRERPPYTIKHFRCGCTTNLATRDSAQDRHMRAHRKLTYSTLLLSSDSSDMSQLNCQKGGCHKKSNYHHSNIICRGNANDPGWKGTWIFNEQFINSYGPSAHTSVG